ncbi:Integrase [Vibrio crassostreae]|nr:Integrase [Vibrio crassostreae]
MNTIHLYDSSFPKEHKVQDVDIVALYHESQFEALDAVIICKNREGHITASFGQNNWDCLPFSRKKTKNNLNFSEFDSAPKLQRELKLITFGWLFNKSPKKKKAVSFSSVHSRLDSIKKVYRFLSQKKLLSLNSLSSASVWSSFESYLQENDSSQGTLVHYFVAINSAINDSSWHNLDLNIAIIKSKKEAERLSDKDKQQTLVIPERLSNAIYSKAIELIDAALPYAELIADTESALQDNYLKGKQILDEKVKLGCQFTFINTNGSIDARKYTAAISDSQPIDPNSIITPLSLKLTNTPLKNAQDFKKYLGQLITASYIVCGGFSGMRDSELDKLTPNSYFKDTFNGRIHHMLQAHTFKLGEKRETWVTAASSKTAINLMTILTMRWRNEANYFDSKYTNSLWVNQTARSKSAVLITKWNDRLQRFCKHFNLVVTPNDYQECLESNPRSIDRVKKTVLVGKPWPLSTHQFRRTLAFYCIKNRLGTLVALKQQFKHLYLSMTEWYTNGGKLASLKGLKIDQQVQQALNEINAETTANKIFKQWHSDEILSGTHGKAIMKMRGDAPPIYSSWDVIYKAVKEGKLTLHGSLHSYCKSGYDCDMDGVVVPQFCVDCSSGSSIIDEQQAKWWQKKHSNLSTYMAWGEDISVTDRSHYITQIRAAENVMRDFGMEFTAFEAGLAVKEI